VAYWVRTRPDWSVEQIGRLLQGKPDQPAALTGLHLEVGADIPNGGAA
jgi:hypothetical protein